nr:hypothetical protein [Tanacetum cinerariifolium]
ISVKLHGVPLTTFSEDGLSVTATKLGTPLMLDSYTTDMCMQSWVRSSYPRAMIELRADVELKDNIVAAMPKIVGEGYYTCNIRVEYEWKPPRCACCKIFGHVLEECPKNIGVGVTKNLKNTSQTPKGISVGQKLAFKPAKQVYQPVSKKSIAYNGGNKKTSVEPTNEVNKSNSFDVLNLVDKDVKMSTNGGSTHLASQEANSSGSLFWNAESSSPNNKGNPLSKVDEDCEDEVASVDNDMANSLAKKDGYGGGGFVGGSGSGGSRLEKREVGLWGMAGKAGWDEQ